MDEGRQNDEAQIDLVPELIVMIDYYLYTFELKEVQIVTLSKRFNKLKTSFDLLM